MASDQLHEPAESLRPETIEMHRALASLQKQIAGAAPDEEE